MQGVLERVDGPTGAHDGVLHFSRGLAVVLHGAGIAFPVERQVMLGRERLEQLWRHAERLVQLRRIVVEDTPLERVWYSREGRHGIVEVPVRVIRREHQRLLGIHHLQQL